MNRRRDRRLGRHSFYVRSFRKHERVFYYYKTTTDDGIHAVQVKECVCVSHLDHEEQHSDALRVKVSTAVLDPSPQAFPAVPGSPQLLISRCKVSPSHLASLHAPHTLHFRLLRPSSQFGLSWWPCPLWTPGMNTLSSQTPDIQQPRHQIHPIQQLVPITHCDSTNFPNLSPPICFPLLSHFITPGHIFVLARPWKVPGDSCKPQSKYRDGRKSSYTLQDLRF